MVTDQIKGTPLKARKYNLAGTTAGTYFLHLKNEGFEYFQFFTVNDQQVRLGQQQSLYQKDQSEIMAGKE